MVISSLPFLAATKGSYKTRDIEYHLKQQWQEGDLHSRDFQKGKGRNNHTSYLGADAETWDSEESDGGQTCTEDEPCALVAGDSSDEDGGGEEDSEDNANYEAALKAEHDALLARHKAQRTLHEARKAQYNTKMGRKFYRNGPPRNKYDRSRSQSRPLCQS